MAASNYAKILGAVFNRVSGAPSVPPVSKRYDLYVTEKDPASLVIVAPSVEKVRIKRQTFGKGVHYEYPVRVMWLSPNNKAINAGIDDYLDLWTAIRNELYQVELPGADPVYDTEMTMDEVSKFAAVVGTNYRVTGWVVWYTAAEQRVS